MVSSEKFSGWAVLSGCFIVMFFILGSMQTFAVFLPSIMGDTGFTLAAIAIMSAVATATAFGANLLIGILLKKFSAKQLLLGGAVNAALSFTVMSYGNTLFLLYLGAFFGGLAVGFGTIAPVSLIMTNWFIFKRATYMSIVIAGSMFGAAVLMPLCGLLIDMFDWRIAYRILAAIVGICVILAIWLLVADKPEDKGQKAYGSGQQANAVEQSSDGVSAAEARSSLSFWLLMVGILLIGGSTQIENFLPAFWRKSGMSVTTSANIMGVYALITAACTIFLGKVTDKLGAKIYVVLTSLLFITGTLCVLYLGVSSFVLMLLVLIPFAAGGKKTSSLTPPLVVSEAFGRKNFGAIIGYFAAMLQLGMALSSVVIGYLYQSSGDYTLPFTVMAGVNALALVLIFVALKLSPYKKTAQ